MCLAPVLYTAVYHHEYGVDVWSFWYTPTAEFPVPSLKKVVEHFSVNFEPHKGEELELLVACRASTPHMPAELIGGKPEEMHYRDEDWPEREDDEDDEDEDSPAVIPAEVHRDDRGYEAKFDALPWFQQATDEQIRALADIGWGGNYAADVVAQFCKDIDQDVEEVLNHTCCEEGMGFECHVDSIPAMTWLMIHRPKLWRAIRDG